MGALRRRRGQAVARGTSSPRPTSPITRTSWVQRSYDVAVLWGSDIRWSSRKNEPAQLRVLISFSGNGGYGVNGITTEERTQRSQGRWIMNKKVRSRLTRQRSHPRQPRRPAFRSLTLYRLQHLTAHRLGAKSERFNVRRSTSRRQPLLDGEPARSSAAPRFVRVCHEVERRCGAALQTQAAAATARGRWRSAVRAVRCRCSRRPRSIAGRARMATTRLRDRHADRPLPVTPERRSAFPVDGPAAVQPDFDPLFRRSMRTTFAPITKSPATSATSANGLIRIVLQLPLNGKSGWSIPPPTRRRTKPRRHLADANRQRRQAIGTTQNPWFRNPNPTGGWMGASPRSRSRRGARGTRSNQNPPPRRCSTICHSSACCSRTTGSGAVGRD
jgi:hypothetical protein